MAKRVIGWWSGGVTSAVACKLSMALYGKKNVRIIFIDTGNEDDDTYRFMKDCEKWYGVDIETISAIGDKYGSIQDVWIKYKGMNFAHGAICSSELKREVRIRWQKDAKYDHQVFGFDMDEPKRARAMTINYPKSKPIYPLLMHGMSKEMCIEYLGNAGIQIPNAYSLGFRNNNCLKTGCVQGGIGYWQKMKRDMPGAFDAMAKMEHKLTELKGAPVTMCKNQSNKAKLSGNTLLFLKSHPKYPHVKTIDDVKGREPEPLFECNGFCGTNDLEDRSSTEGEINNQLDLWEEKY